MKAMLETVKTIALEAGRLILEEYECEHNIEIKADESPVTQADLKANAHIVSKLKEAYPDYGILSEESEDDLCRLENPWCFVIDPLDGTKEYINRNGEFTVNIALSYNHEIIMGVVYVPVLDELYYASKGTGAYVDIAGVKEKICVSDRKQNLRVLVSRSHLTEEDQALLACNKDRIESITPYGSALKGLMIARGQGEVYFRFSRIMEWDIAAMSCIVEEAGGILIKLNGDEFKYNRRDSKNDQGFYVLNCIENKLVKSL